MPQTPTIYLASDHAGYKLKEAIKKALQKVTVLDLSPKLIKDDDYPQHAQRVALALQEQPRAFGILFCGSGHGMDIAANRFHGIRAIVARTESDAKLAREHNHANVLVLGGRVTKSDQAIKIVKRFLSTKPSQEKRHKRRILALDTLTP